MSRVTTRKDPPAPREHSARGRARERGLERGLARALALAAGAVVLGAGVAAAGVDTYFDVFPGDRASAMGGAYRAIADDSSAAFYNPAGLARVPYGDLSVSANAFAFRELELEGALFGQDVVSDGTSFFPASIGAVKRFDRWPEAAIALSIVVAKDFSLKVKQDFRADLFGDPIDVTLDLESKGQTYLVGPAFAWAIGPDLAVGITVYGIYGSQRREDFSTITAPTDDPEFDAVLTFFYESSEDTALGLTGALGLQWSPAPDLDLGLVLRPGVGIAHERDSQKADLLIGDTGGLAPTTGGLGDRVEEDYTEGFPPSIELGLGWRPVERLQLALDLVYHFGEAFRFEEQRIVREPVWNLFAGVEWEALEFLRLRAGGYTNRSAFPDIVPGRQGEIERYDTYGFTVGAAYVVEWAELAVGLRQGWGEGEALAFENPLEVIDVRLTETLLTLSTRYRF